MRMSDVISYVIMAATAFSFILGGSYCVAYDPDAPWDSQKNCIFIFLTSDLEQGQFPPSKEFETIVNKWHDRIRRDQNLPLWLKDEPADWKAIEQKWQALRATAGEREDQAINTIVSKEPEWLDPNLWENVDISGASISDVSQAYYVFSGRKLYKTLGVPITLEGLQRTKQWKERRLDRVRIEGLSLVVSFEGWTIENSYLQGRFNFADASFFNSTISGDCKFKDVAVTRNFKESRLDSIKIILEPLMSRDHTTMSKDWFFFGRCLYDPINLRALLPEKLTAAETVNSLLNMALEGKWGWSDVYRQEWGFDNRRQIRNERYPQWTTENREVFLGAKSEDLYSTLAWQKGDMAGVVFFPEYAKFKIGLGELNGWNLAAQDLTGAKLERLDLANVDFTDSIITDASFIDSVGLTVDQLKTTWNWRVRRMDSVILPPELREEVDRALVAEAN